MGGIHRTIAVISRCNAFLGNRTLGIAPAAASTGSATNGNGRSETIARCPTIPRSATDAGGTTSDATGNVESATKTTATEPTISTTAAKSIIS